MLASQLCFNLLIKKIKCEIYYLSWNKINKNHFCIKYNRDNNRGRN
uniref:Uncharacterized protein n=1 Tax=viral metagenome TaxID=1070528 RepID=A0A6C0AFB9_9ZZZZ